MSRILKARLKATGQSLRLDRDEDFSVDLPFELADPDEPAPAERADTAAVGEVVRLLPGGKSAVAPASPPPMTPQEPPATLGEAEEPPVTAREAEQRPFVPREAEETSISFREAGTLEELRLQGVLRNVLDDKVRTEQFRTLRAKLRLLAQHKKTDCLGVVSVARGEGKTTVASALSLVMAQEPGSRVLLVDADLRKADLEKTLGLKKQPGLAEWLARPTPEIHIRQLSPHRVYFLAAGRSHGRPWELIASPQFARLLAAARHRFDTVVVDCPPLVPVADSALIQQCVDAMLLVVRARTAPRETILGALEQVQEEKIVGMVLNDVRRLVSNFQHFRYQYGKY